LVMVLTAAFSLSANADGIATLKDVGRSMADINREMERETKAFGRVKSAVDRGDIMKGTPKADIMRRYGEPVIANDDSATGREKWVYKPASSTFFKGIKIYLYFDAIGNLDEIRIVS